MNIIENELSLFCDVDDTLVVWGQPISEKTVEFVCPYTGKVENLAPHDILIQILKQQKGRGYHVTVWSAGGWKWAKTVVETLKLQEFVDEIRSKPVKFFDDLPANEILGSRVYLPYKG